MHMLADEVVAIAPEREKFFGCSGRMLLPCPSTVAAVVKEIPSGKVATLELLRSELARRAEVEAVCPFQTKQALRAIAEQTDAVPLWRLVKRSGELLKYLPGGSARQSSLLGKEKVAVEQTATGERVKNLKAHLVSFEVSAS
ncbi:MGMT family protein [Piscinibacter terrae]|uniref:MGMT family protein n=1 Tax=Piscinibacter terrae TaxID=2496871 RepID=A0A3N7HS51_9BURK|nr:MGMT family protein [Albitalea terrae]RQP25097.1 MGMT family protein [Albitalea terrae]